jgi:hypothetical protein
MAAAPLYAEVAATVEFVLGTAFLVNNSGEKQELTKGTFVEAGDSVISEDARVQLRFTDGGFVSLAPHSEFRVNAYSYNGSSDGTERISMELVKGGLRTISGLIGKAIKAAYELKTAVATMGIRGTEYTVVYENGVTGTVSAGAIAVCNAGGCLDVAHGQSYLVTDMNIKPTHISKAAFLPPTQPVDRLSEKKQSQSISELEHSKFDRVAGSSESQEKVKSTIKLGETLDLRGIESQKTKTEDFSKRFDSFEGAVNQKRAPEAGKNFQPVNALSNIDVKGNIANNMERNALKQSQDFDPDLMGKGKLK